MTRARLALLGGLLIVILGFLAAGLSGIEFRGARGEGGEGEALLPAPDEPLALPGPEWLLDLIVIVALVFLVVAVGGALFSRRYRTKLLRALVMLAALAAVAHAISTSLRSAVDEIPLHGEGPAPLLPGSGLTASGEGREEVPPPRVPPWLAYLVAGGGGALIAWWAGRRFRPRPQSAAEEIETAAQSATAELARGLPVSDVVIRCWLRMVEILSPRVNEARLPTLTPRELADRLVALGFRSEPVRILTQLFEEVRYGHKESEPRREAALAALASVERAGG
ncbi:DUF4129 domain-containing protein [Candidatus Bipolaricaulota bacterium]|nr:DUF4129 domain-containing protein [Candidatus Bipolaricaulota bacterium]